jgi:uncharacterized protein YdaU (DUF1376 family)
MAEFPSLPLWTDAFIGDTEHLTHAEAGLYLRILMLMWRSPRCRIPDDDGWLERRLKTPIADVRLIIKEFCQCERNASDAWVTQKRLQKEWNYVQSKRAKNKAAADIRWNRSGNGDTDAMQTQYERNAPTPTPTPTPLRGRGSHADSDSETKPTHAPTRKAAKRQPTKQARQAKQAPRIPMPDTWAPSEAGLQYATDAGIARASFPYLIKRCRDYHIRNGTMIAGERGLAATWRTWCDHEVKFTAEKNGTDVVEDSVPHRGYRPEGWTDADERKLAARSATKIADLLDEGRPVCDQDGNGLGVGRGRHS